MLFSYGRNAVESFVSFTAIVNADVCIRCQAETVSFKVKIQQIHIPNLKQVLNNVILDDIDVTEHDQQRQKHGLGMEPTSGYDKEMNQMNQR